LEFQNLTTHHLFKYCVGAIDGLAIYVEAPTSKGKGGGLNTRRYYSGSKKSYCLNLQGVCDAKCTFIGVSCRTVGSTNDDQAFELSSLKDMMNESLPFEGFELSSTVCSSIMRTYLYAAMSIKIWDTSSYLKSVFYLAGNF
jgi:hypothetical protein